MTGLHALEAYHHAGGPRPTNDATLHDDALVRRFMEQTNFYWMQSQDALASGSTSGCSAAPGDAYIAYTFDYADGMGLKIPPPESTHCSGLIPQTGAQSRSKRRCRRR